MAQAELRRKAQAKFPRAEQMFFEREALEQASSFALARHRALALHARAAPGPVFDLGCGLGGDLIALAALRPVVAYERDPTRAWCARENLRALGLAGEVRCAPIPPRLEGPAAFCDPARRVGGSRVLDPEQHEPPLSRLLGLGTDLVCVKLAPGLESVPEGFGVQFVGVAGECREAVLWSDRPGQRWGSVLLGDAWHEVPSGPDPEASGSLRPGAWLYDPEPVVVRARGLLWLGGALDAAPFDPRIAYLVGEQPRVHPLARRFEVLEVHDFSLKRLQTRLLALGWARIEIKKRGFAMTPEELRRKLRLPRRGGEGVVFLSRRGEQPVAVLARRA